jgi:hypothetical protein
MGKKKKGNLERQAARLLQKALIAKLNCFRLIQRQWDFEEMGNVINIYVRKIT